MNQAFDRHHDAAFEQQRILTGKLLEIEKKTEALEDDYYLDKKIPDETYTRLRTKLSNEKKEIDASLANLDLDSSNLKRYYSFAVAISLKLATVWASSDTTIKEKIQKFIFPDGIYYNREKETFLTRRTNRIFYSMAELNRVSGDDKNKQGGIDATLSSLVGKAGQMSNLLIIDLIEIQLLRCIIQI